MSPKKVEVALPLSYRNHITTAISAMSVQASTESANLKSTTEAAESPKSIVPAYATFTDLPQEMVDNILGMHYATIQKPISVAYRGKYYSPRYLGKREPPVMKMGGAYDPLLRVNKNIAETALKIKAQYPVKLRVVYNEDKGFSALQDSICSYANASKVCETAILGDYRGILGNGSQRSQLRSLRTSRISPSTLP